jgi:hypothetical protein
MTVPRRRILSPLGERHKSSSQNGLRIASPDMTAQGQRATQDQPLGLAEVVAAWPTLPEPIRAGILAMIRSASGKER